MAMPVFDSEDKIPEALKEHYVELNGKWVPDVEREDNSKLKSAAEHEKDQRKEMGKKLEALTAMGPPTLQRGRFTVPDKLMAMLSDAGNGRNYAK